MVDLIPIQPISPLWRRALHFAGMDRAVAFGFLARVWSMGSGLIALVLIAAFFTPQVQGFHYTFMSLIALQVFAEMGLGQVLIQFASHEWAHLKLAPDGGISGDAQAEARLSGLAYFAVRWFVVAAFFFLLGIEVVGFYIFGSHSGGVRWQWPWTALCLAVGADLCTLPLMSLLEGTNQVASAYFIRFARAIISGVTLWSAIALGAGLWSAALSIGAGVLLTGVLLFGRHGRFFKSLFSFPVHQARGWWGEVWPMQWRIALSWLSGYLSFSLFTPVLFRFGGPVVAGQMGMSWSLVQAVSAVAALLVQTKAPTFGVLIAQRKWHELDRMALRVGLSSFVVAMAGAVAVGLFAYLLQTFHFRLAGRLLPLPSLSLFLVGMLAVQFTFPFSVYLRAHKREPLVVISAVTGMLIGASTITLGYFYGAFGMAAGYAGTSLFIGVPWLLDIFRKCRAHWHAVS